ncbi:hypothetical protein L9F63_000910, partial [Diploptera punctata]
YTFHLEAESIEIMGISEEKGIKLKTQVPLEARDPRRSVLIAQVKPTIGKYAKNVLSILLSYYVAISFANSRPLFCVMIVQLES